MDELEQKYKGKIDVIRYNLATNEGYCEYQRHGATHIPFMLFISVSGNEVEKTDTVLEKDALDQKMQNLLAQP
ncbi:MAG: hypothetical protein ACYC6O_07210 [Thermoleophilia bacterium]